MVANLRDHRVATGANNLIRARIYLLRGGWKKLYRRYLEDFGQ